MRDRQLNRNFGVGKVVCPVGHEGITGLGWAIHKIPPRPTNLLRQWASPIGRWRTGAGYGHGEKRTGNLVRYMSLN